MRQLPGDGGTEMRKLCALPVWRPGGSGEKIYDGVWTMGQRDKDRGLWECTRSYRGEDRPGVSDLLKVIL